MTTVDTFPMFIQLLDDDIVSLTTLTLIVNPECRDHANNVCVSQLTLSLYLMTQCQLKLRHSVTSLTQTLSYIRVAQRRIPVDWTLDQLTLKLSARVVLRHVNKLYNSKCTLHRTYTRCCMLSAWPMLMINVYTFPMFI